MMKQTPVSPDYREDAQEEVGLVVAGSSVEGRAEAVGLAVADTLPRRVRHMGGA